MAEKFKVKKGDQVVVTTGRDKGKKGEVLRVIRESRRVVVSGANVAKRHTRQAPGNPGGIVDKEMSLDISNVALVDPKSGEPTRVGFRTLEDGRKVRFAKRSGEVIDL
ncbi:MAG: 50S ribosomal protein L24 [Alphaproteobacteria bacterium]|nr:50S ribosomal protein L24 [Alphaproteobacteria bacterium]